MQGIIEGQPIVIAYTHVIGTMVCSVKTPNWANNDPIDTQKILEIYDTNGPLVSMHEIAVKNPSTVTDLTLKMFSHLEDDSGDFSASSYIKTVTIPKAQTITGTLIDTYSFFVENLLVGAFCLLILSNDTALGAADEFTANVYVRRVR